MFLAVQRESEQAVSCAKEVLTADSVSGFWVGPVDVANSLWVDLSGPGGAEAHEAVSLRVLETCGNTHEMPGIAASDNAQR